MADKKTGNIEKVLAWGIYVGLLIVGLICCKNALSDYIAAKTLLNLSYQSITQNDLPTIVICYPNIHKSKVSGVKSWKKVIEKHGIGSPAEGKQITNFTFGELKTLEPNSGSIRVSGCLKISPRDLTKKPINPDEYFYFALNFTGKEKPVNLSIYVTSEDNSFGVVGLYRRWYDGKVQKQSFEETGLIRVWSQT